MSAKLPTVYRVMDRTIGYAPAVVPKRCRAEIWERGRGARSHQCGNLPKRWLLDGEEVDQGTKGALGFCLRCYPDENGVGSLYIFARPGYGEPLEICEAVILRETPKQIHISGDLPAFGYKRVIRKEAPSDRRFLSRTPAEALARAKANYTKGRLEIEERLASVGKKLERIRELEDEIFPPKED